MPATQLPPVVGISVTPPPSIELARTVSIHVALPVTRSNVTVRLVHADGGLGAGVCPPVLAGDCLGITRTLSIEQGVTDAQGEVQIDLTLPASYPADWHPQRL